MSGAKKKFTFAPLSLRATDVCPTDIARLSVGFMTDVACRQRQCFPGSTTAPNVSNTQGELCLAHHALDVSVSKTKLTLSTAPLHLIYSRRFYGALICIDLFQPPMDADKKK
jgi:hypothetical protein